MKNDEAVGKQILEKRQNAKNAQAGNQSKLSMAESVVQQARSELTQLRAYIFEFESKKDVLIDRARQAKTQARLNNSFRSALGKGQSVMDFINTMEKKVTEQEVLSEVGRHQESRGHQEQGRRQKQSRAQITRPPDQQTNKKAPSPRGLLRCAETAARARQCACLEGSAMVVMIAP